MAITELPTNTMATFPGLRTLNISRKVRIINVNFS